MEEDDGSWALYFDKDNNNLKEKVQGMRITEVELIRDTSGKDERTGYAARTKRLTKAFQKDQCRAHSFLPIDLGSAPSGPGISAQMDCHCRTRQ